MRRLGLALVPLTLSLVACGGGSSSSDAAPGGVDGAQTADAAAEAPDFSCRGVTPPTTAPATIQFTGVVFDLVEDGELPVGTARAYKASDDTLLGEGATGEDGSFTLSLDTGGVPLDVRLEVQIDGVAPVDFFPPTLSEDSFLPVPVAKPLEIAAVYDSTSTTLTLDSATVAMAVLDCANQPIAGATLTADPAGDLLTYIMIDELGELWFDETMTYDTGLATLLNAQTGKGPASVTISGNVGSEALATNSRVKVRPGVMAVTFITP